MLSLIFDPSLKFPDGFTLYRQLNVCIGRVNFRTSGMAHERHAYFLHDAGLHKAGIKGMAEIMEADVTNLSVSENRFPRRLDDPDRLAAELNEEPFRLALR